MKCAKKKHTNHRNQFATAKSLNAAPVISYSQGSGGWQDWKRVVTDGEHITFPLRVFQLLTPLSLTLELENKRVTTAKQQTNTRWWHGPTNPTYFLNFLPVKNSLTNIIFYSKHGLTETIKWEMSLGMTQGCQNHESCWICEPSSRAPFITFPTPHWISSLLPEFLHSGSGSAYGHGTELDWIGQWSHCKCITLTPPIFQSYLQTESHYYCRSST